jgi:hypothetical protein
MSAFKILAWTIFAVQRKSKSDIFTYFILIHSEFIRDYACQ